MTAARTTDAGPSASVVGVHPLRRPRHAGDGWTAEPRERYYERLGLRDAGRPDPRA